MRVLQDNLQNRNMRKRHSAEQIIRVLGEINIRNRDSAPGCPPDWEFL
jgi:hypothetical protein